MNDRRAHQHAAYGRDPYDPYDDPYAGDQLAGARYDQGGPRGGHRSGAAATAAGRGCSARSSSCCC